jgi:hypothetical protein
VTRPTEEAAVGNPVNAGLRSYLEPRHQRPNLAALAFPDELSRPYDSLGTHPDLVSRLWDELGKVLPTDCRAVFYGTPVLLRPDTAVVFAFAGGTHTYAFRLPELERLEAIGAGASRIKRYSIGPSLDLDRIGSEWVLGGWYRGELTRAESSHGFERRRALAAFRTTLRDAGAALGRCRGRDSDNTAYRPEYRPS